MRATKIPDAITLLVAAWVEGQLVLETGCEDYDAFKALPAAVTYQGVECGKTGWSSDTGRACYKSGAPVAYSVKSVKGKIT